jgi:hypothetical protein
MLGVLTMGARGGNEKQVGLVVAAAVVVVVVVVVVVFPWASVASHGCTAACWLIVPPALDVQTLATRCTRAYRRVPHFSGGSWNL